MSMTHLHLFGHPPMADRAGEMDILKHSIAPLRLKQDPEAQIGSLLGP